MVHPNFPTFKKLTAKGNLIPVVKELILDCETPVSVFQKIALKEKSAFLLESVEYGEKIGRYSFLGYDPDIILEQKRGSVLIKEQGKKIRRKGNKDILAVMKQVLQKYCYVPLRGLPVLCGGFVGFLSYENVVIFEDIQLKKRASLGFPLAIFFLTKKLLVFDHVDKKVRIIVLSSVRGDIKGAYNKALRDIAHIERKLSHYGSIKKVKGKDTKKLQIESNMSKSEFESAVKKIKHYIREGDVIQVVLSQRLSLGTINNDFNVYRALRTVNPSPYMFYFKHNAICLIGSSPEVLVKNEGGHAEVRPIAGTRKRGRTEAEDLCLAEDLKQDEKELAEHLMLVDLGRNDLGRVCTFNSVAVKDYARVEKYSHVMHLVSEVHGLLKKKKDSFDLVRATFPAGTLTGAPKIRAMEIINELESSERGPYGGCLGYFSVSGDCDMCITIRTIMIKDKKAYLQAGAGIVYDSVPAREYRETLNKAKALIKAVEIAEEELA
ncbi:MAG: anthranilate synthase component I [Candidatus Omnitrophica bacterium]|nr:anthranilate synthase component I [Candidatus Omnitrophota bacterium]